MAVKRTFNPRLIRVRRSYSFAEVAELYGIHLRTVHRWRKEGLSVLEEASKPFLVMGVDVQGFLRERQRKRKHPLKLGEFFCSKCRCARRSLPEMFRIEITEKRLGKQSRQALIRGICEVCGQRLLLFSSDKKVAELRQGGLLLSEREEKLGGSEDASVKTDIGRGGDGESKLEERTG